MMFPTKFPQSSLLTGKLFLPLLQPNDPKIEGADACKSASRQPCSFISTESRFYVQVDTGRLHRTDDLTSANVPDATSAIRLRAGRVFPAFAAILIPASVLSKKSARLSMSVRASSSPSI